MRRSCSPSTGRSPASAGGRSCTASWSTACTRAAVLVGSDFRFGARGSGRRRPAARTRKAARLHRAPDRRRAAGARPPGLLDLDPGTARGRATSARRRTCSAMSPAVRGVVVHGAAARPGARLPDREPLAATPRASSRRTACTPAGSRIDGRALSGRDLGRQQPDLRGRPAEAGRGVRARPRRSTSTTTGRGRVRRAHPRHGGVRGHRTADRADRRGRRSRQGHPHGPVRRMTDAATRPLWRGRTIALVGILLVAANLRTAVAALSPIFAEIRLEFPISSLGVGLLGMLPPVCFAVFGHPRAVLHPPAQPRDRHGDRPRGDARRPPAARDRGVVRRAGDRLGRSPSPGWASATCCCRPWSSGTSPIASGSSRRCTRPSCR